MSLQPADDVTTTCGSSPPGPTGDAWVDLADTVAWRLARISDALGEVRTKQDWRRAVSGDLVAAIRPMLADVATPGAALLVLPVAALGELASRAAEDRPIWSDRDAQDAGRDLAEVVETVAVTILRAVRRPGEVLGPEAPLLADYQRVPGTEPDR
ncbi:hypothetical protein [Glycomyces xiaoerkulensis]|uniref:hypothetical protein n=1 Tax=Glycomyces xiaoerkulensis TaxID=2038139 RepID=UPI000C25C462|nr:hypothetical protein [Glycomyces xiaoerkulensis]